MSFGTLAGAFLSPVLGQVADKFFSKLDGIGSSLGNAIGGIFGRQDSVDASLSAQKSLFDYQAEYNSPLNQRMRLEEAGYNPALMYGTTMAHESMPTSNIGPYSLGVDPYQLSKIANTIANTDLSRAKVATEKMQLTLSSLDAESKKILNEIAHETKDEQIQYYFERNAKTHHESVKLYNETNKVVEEMNSLLASQGLTKAQTAKVWEELAGLKATNDINNYRYQIEKDLGYFGSAIVQNYIGMGADFITDLIGVAKIFKSVPKMIGKSTTRQSTTDPWSQRTSTYETYHYE